MREDILMKRSAHFDYGVGLDVCGLNSNVVLLKSIKKEP